MISNTLFKYISHFDLLLLQGVTLLVSTIALTVNKWLDDKYSANYVQVMINLAIPAHRVLNQLYWDQLLISNNVTSAANVYPHCYVFISYFNFALSNSDHPIAQTINHDKGQSISIDTLLWHLGLLY